jgi:hypothetical protein
MRFVSVKAEVEIETNEDETEDIKIKKQISLKMRDYDIRIRQGRRLEYIIVNSLTEDQRSDRLANRLIEREIRDF